MSDHTVVARRDRYWITRWPAMGPEAPHESFVVHARVNCPLVRSHPVFATYAEAVRYADNL